jgi:hypothetical protein
MPTFASQRLERSRLNERAVQSRKSLTPLTLDAGADPV